MQALEQEGAVHQEEENKDTADADTVAGRARAMLQRTLSDRINPWKVCWWCVWDWPYTVKHVAYNDAMHYVQHILYVY